MNDILKSPLDVPLGSGGFAIREVVRFAFFIRRPHRDIAAGVVGAIDELIDLFPPPAISTFAIESGDWLPFDAKGLKRQVRKFLIGKDAPINGVVRLAGDQANIPDFSIDYEGYAIDRPTFKKGASWLSFQVAAGAFSDYREQAFQIAHKIFTYFDCSAAYIDLALEGDQTRKQAMSHRYRSIDISDIGFVAADLADKLPGIFWQNMIGPQLGMALGGRAAVSAVLSSKASVEETASGALIVTLGSSPDRGDVNRTELDADRIALARLAHERGILHVPRAVTYFEPEDDLDDTEAQEKWHLRYLF